MKYFFWLSIFLLAMTSAFLDPPLNFSNDDWHFLSMFMICIYAIICRVYPMGMVVTITWLYSILSGLIKPDLAFTGFHEKIVWLVVCAFFISRGVIKTGLGKRIALYFVRFFGSNSIGLGYSIVCSELLLAPCIPSITARGGGVILPVVHSICESMDSFPNSKSRDRLGTYLTMVGMHANTITSAIFLTGMAANSVIIDRMPEQMKNQINVSYINWFYAMFFPCLILILLCPLLLWILSPPRLKKTLDAPKIAEKQLKELGLMKYPEYMMVGIFVCIIICWIKPFLILNVFPMMEYEVFPALLGLVLMLLTQIIEWDDVVKESGAWKTLIWFSILFLFSSQLNERKIMLALTDSLDGLVTLSGYMKLVFFSALYFYSHYFFASNLAHIIAFCSVVMNLNYQLPYYIVFWTFAGLSSLFGSMTHYASGPAPLYYTIGYVPFRKWWYIGAIMSTFYFMFWLTVANRWWYFLINMGCFNG